LKILKRIFGFEDIEKWEKRDVEILCYKSGKERKNPNKLSASGVAHAIFQIKLDIAHLRANQNWIIRFMWIMFGILLYSLK